MTLQYRLVVVSLATVVRCAIIIDAGIDPPSFTTTPTWPDMDYYDENGPPISLLCRMKTMDGVSLLWYRDGFLLENSKLIAMANRNQTVTLLIPKQNQTGSYTCKATNIAGNVSHTGFIYIAGRKQETRPRITATDPEGLVKYGAVGDNITISCVFDVGGNDLALMDLTTTWMKNNSIIPDTNHSTHGINVTKTKNQLFSLTITFLKAADYGVYTCIGQNKLGNDSKLITVSPPKKTSDKLPWYLIVAVSVGGVFVFGSIVMATMLIRRRRQWNTYKELDWQEPDMSNFQVPKHVLQYDVFISYSSNDLKWVKDVLFNTLVTNGYSVCIDFKDFTPGMAISENIIDAIYKSRTTIVLLSNNFLQSMWGQFELQQAHSRAVVQRDDVLILIKYDESKVPVKLMGKTFLDWSDEKVRPHFWQRLYEAIGEPADFKQLNEDNTKRDEVKIENTDKKNDTGEYDIADYSDKIDNDINVDKEKEMTIHIVEKKEQNKDNEQDELHDSGMGEDQTDENGSEYVRNETHERLIYKQQPDIDGYMKPDLLHGYNAEEQKDSINEQVIRSKNDDHTGQETVKTQKFVDFKDVVNHSDEDEIDSGNIDNQGYKDFIDLGTDQDKDIVDINAGVFKKNNTNGDTRFAIDGSNENQVNIDTDLMVNVH